MMAARRALIGLMIAFAVATVIAAVTTIRQVRMETSSVSQPASRPGVFEKHSDGALANT
jgi:hypothetical protein